MTEPPRRSRTAWPAPQVDRRKNISEGHTHKLPKALRVVAGALVVCTVALTAAVAVLFVYVLDVRDYRNQQFRNIQEQIRQGQCDLLDQFPEGGLLQRPRDKYGCGPGIPLDKLTPEERAELDGRSRPQIGPPQSPSGPPPTIGDGASPYAPKPTPENPT